MRWALLLPIALVACGPTRSTTLIVEANAELAAARTAQAPGVAPYEYLAAEHYLHKAREEQSYADFEVAEKLAKKARDCARVARARAEAKTRSEIGASASKVKVNAICHAGPVGESGERRGMPGARQPASAAPAPAAQQEKPREVVKPKDEPDDPLPEGEEPNE